MTICLEGYINFEGKKWLPLPDEMKEFQTIFTDENLRFEFVKQLMIHQNIKYYLIHSYIKEE